MGAPYRDCIWKVSQRKAPGAISAIAFIVRPVRPSVPLVGCCSFAMVNLLSMCCLKGAPLTLSYDLFCRYPQGAFRGLRRHRKKRSVGESSVSNFVWAHSSKKSGALSAPGLKEGQLGKIDKELGGESRFAAGNSPIPADGL